MTETDVLTEAQANAIYDVLVAEAGAHADSRDQFVYTQTHRHTSEYRFMGKLGFGGKFWRNDGRGPDGSWGEQWYVDCYREQETPERLALIEATNARLSDLRTEVPK